MRAIGAWQRRVARRRGVVAPKTGAVMFVQRFGGLVNLNVHFHLVVPDGVFVDDGDNLAFVMHQVPTSKDVLVILDRIVRRVARRLAAEARDDDEVLALAATAHAQAINVNFGPAGTKLPSSYAAAGNAGTWNNFTGIGPMFDLVALDGAPTAITAYQSPTDTLLAASDPSVSGDDATLLNNGLVTSGAETCLFFSGFQPGRYEVFIYAWLPNRGDEKSRTRQDQAAHTIDVGGAWSGAHVEGVTYARYIVDVDADGMLPAHSGLAPGATEAALNAVQIRPLGMTPPDGGSGSSSGSGSGSGSGSDDPMTDPGGCSSTHSRVTGGSGALVLFAFAFAIALRADSAAPTGGPRRRRRRVGRRHNSITHSTVATGRAKAPARSASRCRCPDPSVDRHGSAKPRARSRCCPTPHRREPLD